MMDLEIIRKKKFVDLKDFGDTLYQLTLIEKQLKLAKDWVKKQGQGMFYDNVENITKIETEKYSIIQTQGSESKDYDPKTVIEVFSEILGESAWTLVESKNAKINQLLASMLITGAISPEQHERLKFTIKRKKGFLMLREKKDNKLIE